MIILGIGTNVGDRLDFLRRAVDRLRRHDSPLHVVAHSPIYESEALLPDGLPDDQRALWNQPFLNLAIAVESQLDSGELLAFVKGVEREIGRRDRGRWAPREIDIDILLFGKEELAVDRLKIPHQHLCDRPFAALPTADLIVGLHGSHRPWRTHSLNTGSPHRALHRAFAAAAEDFPQLLLDRLLPIVSRWRASTSDHVPFATKRSRYSLCELVGILNVTPDSFSDGGRFLAPEAAVEQGLNLVEQGATLLDIGAESTRPGASLISSDEEWRRLEPVLNGLRMRLPSQIRVRLSVDTRHAETASRALANGVDWINDVGGLAVPEMRATVAAARAEAVFMHSLTLPADPKSTLPTDVDPRALVLEWADKRLRDCEESGIDRGRLLFDPGIGFGTTPEQSWNLLRDIHLFHSLGVRVLVGHSRKSFMAKSGSTTGKPVAAMAAKERDLETAWLSAALAHQGARFLRVHDIDSNRRALETAFYYDGFVSYE